MMRKVTLQALIIFSALIAAKLAVATPISEGCPDSVSKTEAIESVKSDLRPGIADVGNNHLLYLGFHQRLASKTSSEYKARVPITGIFESAASARRELAKMQFKNSDAQDPNHLQRAGDSVDFGKPRSASGIDHLALQRADGLPVGPAEVKLYEMAKRKFEEREKVILEISKKYGLTILQNNWLFRNGVPFMGQELESIPVEDRRILEDWIGKKVSTLYETLDHQVLTLTYYEFEMTASTNKNPKINIYHPEAANPYRYGSNRETNPWAKTPTKTEVIFQDVLERIEQVRKSSLSRDEKFTALTKAMRGYFAAMPYTRGGASIGRAVFAGLFMAVLSASPVLEDGIDVYAMLLTDEEFLTRFRQTAGLSEFHNQNEVLNNQ